MLAAERLRELLDYDPKTGEFRWVKKGRRRQQVGCLLPNGYVCIGLDGERYYAHRLAWLWMTGEWPESQIDHLNRNRADNKFSNLRSATQQQNQRNRSLSRNNTSGVTGVHRSRNRWRVKIWGTEIGSFPSKEEAIQAATGARGQC